MNQKQVILLLAGTILTLASTRSIRPDDPSAPANNITGTTPSTISEQKNTPAPGGKVAELKGYLKILHNEDKLAQFRIYFNGMETTNNPEGFFSFPLIDGKPESLTLIISKQVNPEFEKTNTIKNLSIDPKKHYKAYALKTAPFGNMSWEETKIEPENTQAHTKHYVIPQNSIVILVDPKYIDHLAKWQIEFADNDLHLPQILLKAHAETKIKHAANKSLLYTLDTKIFHEKITQRTKPMDKGNILLPW